VKIFGIGFHKTGTTSLARALKILGFTVTGPNGVGDPDISLHALALAKSLVTRYDAFQDNPWPILYKELYSWYPDGKFILTVRNPQRWLNSQLRHFGYQTTPMRQWIYGRGCPQGNEQRYLDRYNKHNNDVLDFFKKQNKQICVMNIEEGDAWDKLCRYLDVPVPARPFPHANKAAVREQRMRGGKN